MIGDFEQAKQRYDSIVVPAPQRFSTGPEETREIGRLTDEYLQSVYDSLRFSARALDSFLSIRYRTLMREDAAGKTRVTDDFDTSLWLGDAQPLASIRNVRDDFNHQVILFAKYPFGATAEMELRELYKNPDVSAN